MEVKDLILYQVATDRNYKVGDILEFGKDWNFQGLRTLNIKQYDDKGRLSQQGFSFVDGKHLFCNKNLVLKLSKNIDEADFVIRELAAEFVRCKDFSTLPSRMRCMFLTDNKENCLKGLKEFYKKGFGTTFQAVAVKVSGQLFYAKDVFLGRNGLSFAEYMSLAEKYWSQDQNSTSPTKEILFEGKAEIVEILDEYIYTRKN